MVVALSRQLDRRRLANKLNGLLPLELSAKTPELTVRPGPIGKPNGPGLWHVKGMGFPPYFQNVRNALIRNGHSVESASRITWGAIRRWARGGGNVHPEVRAAARSALSSIASKEARAHAQHAEHEYVNVRTQLVLREFARNCHSVELADPYHNAQGQFTSAGNQGSAQPKTSSGKPTPGGRKPISQRKRQYYLQLAAQAAAQAARLRQQAAKLNLQINALAALIAQETKFLQTAAAGATAAGYGAKTATTASGTATQTGKGTQTAKAANTQAAAQRLNQPTTRQLLQRNLAQYQQLTAKRDQLLQQASHLDQQAANYRQLANG